MCTCVLAVMTACGRGQPARPPASSTTAEPADGPRPGEILTMDLVLERISTTYRRQLRRCYQSFLKHNGGAGGKVTLEFTVDATGHLINPRASGMTPEITTCITRRMSEWYFAPPASSREEASFRIPLMLVAE